MEFTDRYQSGMIFICDAQGRLLSANPPALAGLKLSQTQAAGLSIDTLFECRPPQSLMPFVRGNEPGRLFCELLSLGGRKSVDLYIEPLRDVADEMSGAILAARDLPAYAESLVGMGPSNASAQSADPECRAKMSDWDEDMEIARAVQQSMLPDKLELRGLRAAAAYRPSLAVGGDFYDAFQVSPERMAILIFDVAGHGVAAALYAAMAKALFARYVTREDSPSEVFYRVNRELAKIAGQGKYLTAFLGFFDVKDKMLTYSGAGHPAPLLLRPNGAVTELHGKSAFLGMFGDEDPDYTAFGDLCMPLTTGDRILLYTDGLPEAIDGTGRLFGIERLRQTFLRTGSSLPQEAVDALRDTVNRHMGETPQADDITYLVVEVQ